MPLELVLLTFMSLVAYVTQHMSHNIISGLCHSLGLGSIAMAYVTKVCFNLNLVYCVTRTYATKACVT
jgi:hypothetical protein